MATLFLDQVGELPLIAQVKLLRVVQEQTLTRVGAAQPVRVDARIIAATNRQLLTEIHAGRFRRRPVYRLAVAVLKLPPLQEREGDLSLLMDRLLTQVNQEGREDPGYEHKNLSPGARNLLLTYSSPGNVRELLNTLRRAALWSEGATITREDAQEALLLFPAREDNNLLELPLIPASTWRIYWRKWPGIICNGRWPKRKATRPAPLIWWVCRVIRLSKTGWRNTALWNDGMNVAFPEMKGFSFSQSQGYIRYFAEAWRDGEFMQVPLAQLPWYHQLAQHRADRT